MDKLQTNLAFVYRLIVASERLLERAKQQVLERWHETECRYLLDYYRQHLAEETGHAEMLADDLLRLGVRDIPRFHLAELMAGSQYYLIEHEHPAALLGYMAALESREIKLDDVTQLEIETGVQMSALRLHAERDPHHIREIREMIEKLPAEVRQLVTINEMRVRDQLAAAPYVIFRQLH